MNLYQIMVRMTLENGVSPVLRVIAHDLMHVGHHLSHATLLATRFRTALVGAGSAFIGTGVLKGLAGVVDHGGEMLKIQNQMIAGGWKAKDLAEATAKAWQLSAKYQSVGAAEILEMQKEMAPVLGDRHHATEIAEVMTRMQVSMQGVLGADKAKQFHRQIRDAVRAGELSGNALQPERFEKYLGIMTKALNAFGGTITPSDFMQATKYGRASALNWSDEFTERVLPTLIQELGASSTGTAFMTMYQAMIGGRMSLRSIKAWDDLGLIDRTKLDTQNLTKEGRIKRLAPQAITGTYEFMSNPYEWMHKYLIPAMLKKGIMSQEGMDEVNKGNIKEGLGQETMRKMTGYLAIMFGDRTGQGMADLLALQKRKIDRDAKLIGEAMGLDAGAVHYLEKDYLLAKIAIEKQWENLNTAMAMPHMADATSFIKGIAGALSSLVSVASSNPGAIKVAMIAIAAVAASLVAVGTALLGFAVLGTGGLVATGLGAVGLFLAGLTAVNWDKIKGAFGNMDGWRADMLGGLGGLSSWLKGLFQGDRLDARDLVVSSSNNITKRIMRAIWDDLMSTRITFDASKAMDTMRQIGEALATAITSIPGMVMGAITGMASGIGSAIARALGSLVPGGPANKLQPGGDMPLSDGPVVPQRFDFVPPPKNPVIQTRTQLNIDGRRIADAVSHYMARASEAVQSAAQFDGRMAPEPVDLYT